MYILLSFYLLIFGLAQRCSSDVLFLAASTISRFGEGLATSLNISTLMAMISSYYHPYSSYLSAEILGIQLSVLVGPLWGGLLFNLLRYTGIFVS